MTREMSHDEAFAALGALAIDALDPDERAAVLAHASTCLTCRQELAELREAASSLAYSAPAVVGAALLFGGCAHDRHDDIPLSATEIGEGKEFAPPAAALDVKVTVDLTATRK